MERGRELKLRQAALAFSFCATALMLVRPDARIRGDGAAEPPRQGWNEPPPHD